MAVSLVSPSVRSAPVQDPVLQSFVADGRVADEVAAELTADAAAERRCVAAIVAGRELIPPAEWADVAARVHGVARVVADEFPRMPLLAEQLSPRFLRHAAVLPIRADDSRLWLAMADPGDAYATRAVALAARREVVPLAAAMDDLEKAYSRYWDEGQNALQRIVEDLGTEFGEEQSGDLENLVDMAREAPVVRLVDQLLTDALRMRASDIHIEPARDTLRVRYRIHGRLRAAATPPARFSAAIVSRIKILAKLDIAERRLPQDGRARLTLLGRRIDLRIATTPTIHGESLVVRILDNSAAGIDFPGLGMPPAMEARLKHQLDAPYGMLLVTGPTGSGKTTTLYAALRYLNDQTDKLISIEDPVEYQIDGVTQIQVRPEIELGFARILRSVVRQDPDIVMVGETRDHETAEIAVQAALTGHLLLTTLHTNSAAGAVARLLDMGVEPYLLASVLRGVVGQRLVGVLCSECKQPHPAAPDERAFFTEAGLDVPDPLILYRPVGCEACDGLGIVGRRGIYEFFDADERVRELIRTRAPTQAVAQAAIDHGMETMFVDGLRKAAAGLTTLEEVCRVTTEW